MRRFKAVAAMAALLAAPAAGAREWKVATWNMEWLTLRPAGDPALPPGVRGRTAAEIARLRAYALKLDADVVALQEVEAAAAALVFPPERYDLALAEGSAVQHAGFAIRRGLGWRRNPDLAALALDPGAAHPLRAGADVTLLPPGGAPLRLLAVHLKSGCWAGPIDPGIKACGTLRAQLPVLAAWVAARRGEGVAFGVLGDFNRRLDRPEEMGARLAEAAPLLRATAGRLSPCGGGEQFIDHLLFGGPARGWVEAGSLRVMTYGEGGPAPSDHCPVSVRLRMGE